MNPNQLDETFNEFASNIAGWIPEGIIEVNMELLEELGLLQGSKLEEDISPDQLPHYFHVIETSEKVTLFNHQFVVWIVPKSLEDTSTTLVFIALLTSKKPHLEIVFSTGGVYNTPKYVLKILRHYLTEVIDTEEAISSIEKNPKSNS
ncbi:MAG: hypothetical protein KAR79_01155 [Simkaniaceae bacterium]|nr:hypothetical protein [Simkaniaceae bacterium]